MTLKRIVRAVKKPAWLYFLTALTGISPVKAAENLSDRTLTILAIDGGGVRGVLPACVLVEIEKRTGKPIAEQFDLIAGVSTGGILALGLNVPSEGGHPKYNTSDILNLYFEEAETIFPTPPAVNWAPSIAGSLTTVVLGLSAYCHPSYRWLASMATGLTATVTAAYTAYSIYSFFLQDLFFPKHLIEGMQKVFGGYFADTRLSQAITPTIALSYDMKAGTPHLFSSIHANANKYYEYSMKDVAEATAHAQTFFNFGITKNFNNDTFYLLDGGNVANNPTLIALLFAQKHFRDFDNYFVVSLGTGDTRTYIDPEKVPSYLKGGGIHWAIDTISILMSSSSELIEHTVASYLRRIDAHHHYYRLDTVITEPEQKEMDNAKRENLEGLLKVAGEMIKQREKDISTIAEGLNTVRDKRRLSGKSPTLDPKEHSGSHVLFQKSSFKDTLKAEMKHYNVEGDDIRWVLEQGFFKSVPGEDSRNKLSFEQPWDDLEELSERRKGQLDRAALGQLQYTNVVGERTSVTWEELPNLIRAMRKAQLPLEKIDTFPEDFTPTMEDLGVIAGTSGQEKTSPQEEKIEE